LALPTLSSPAFLPFDKFPGCEYIEILMPFSQKEGPMKFTDLRRRTVSLLVLIAFVALLQGGPAPAPTSPATDNARDGARLEDIDAPGSFEAEGDDPGIAKKQKKFPWLFAALGAVAVGVTIYFLVIKKTKYTLTVKTGPGIDGFPLAPGRYKKGEAVSYEYSARQGYGDLKVILDGRAVPASGTVTMNRDHELLADAIEGASGNPVQLATLEVNSTGIGGEIYLDGRDSMFFTPHTFTFTTAVTKSVLVRQCYHQDWSMPSVHVGLGEKVVLNAVQKQGIRDDFIAEDLFPCWIIRDPSTLSLGAGALRAVGPKRGYQYALYDISPAYDWPDYTISTRLRIVSGISREFGNTVGIVLSTTTDMASSQGYEISFHGDREYVIYKNNRYNHLYDTGNWRYIRFPSLCVPRAYEPGAWNTIKIVKVAANYTFYVNDRFVFSFVSDDYDARFPALAVFGREVKVDFDWIWLEPGVTKGSVPGAKLEEGREMAGGRNKQ
jgi:hypothetical protein